MATKKELPGILKQYDRILAVVSLAGLLLSLYYLVSVGAVQEQRAREVTDELTDVRANNASLTAVDLTSYKAATTAKLVKIAMTDSSSDLFTPEQRALCYICKKPIGWDKDVCSFCGATQPNEGPTVETKSDDEDEDGMLDTWELANGLDPKDPSDAEADADSDGFINLDEFLAKSNPQDAKAHPDYATLIHVVSVEGKRVPLQLTNRQAWGIGGKSFRCDFRVDDGAGTANLSIAVGETKESPIDKTRRYRLDSLTVKTEKRSAEAGPAKSGMASSLDQLNIDVSEAKVTCFPENQQVTIVFSDKNNPTPPTAPMLTPEATLAGKGTTPDPAVVSVGATFKVKGKTYLVKNVNQKASTVTVENVENKLSFVLKESEK